MVYSQSVFCFRCGWGQCVHRQQPHQQPDRQRDRPGHPQVHCCGKTHTSHAYREERATGSRQTPRSGQSERHGDLGAQGVTCWVQWGRTVRVSTAGQRQPGWTRGERHPSGQLWANFYFGFAFGWQDFSIHLLTNVFDLLTLFGRAFTLTALSLTMSGRGRPFCNDHDWLLIRKRCGVMNNAGDLCWHFG